MTVGATAAMWLPVRWRGVLYADTPSRLSVNIHASRPGRPKCAAASHLQQNPRRWRPDIHQGDHTQLAARRALVSDAMPPRPFARQSHLSALAGHA
eukprot:scaffold118176_cov36-Phaeocystis_antarctica.AAC.1